MKNSLPGDCKLKYACVKSRSSQLKIWNYDNLIFGASLLAAVFWSPFRTNFDKLVCNNYKDITIDSQGKEQIVSVTEKT